MAVRCGRKSEIGFTYDGKRHAFSSSRSDDYAAFRKYMNLVFAYAGTYSLEHELKPAPLADIAIGDVFIKGGFPGHAVLVADMVENPATGEKRFLLIQSYMPAQEMHVLKNPARPTARPGIRPRSQARSSHRSGRFPKALCTAGLEPYRLARQEQHHHE